MKPSGVEWLGDIPDHWEVTNLIRFTTRIGDGLHGTPNYVDESDYYFINGNNLSSGKIIFGHSTRNVSENVYLQHKNELNETTLLLSINGTIGNLAFYQNEKVILGKSAAYINCRKALQRDFLYFFLQSIAISNYYNLVKTGTTIFNLSLESIRKISIVVPDLKEQKEIVANLNQETFKYKILTEKIIKEISIIQEYRTRLIADVVTGKLDVREAAAQLPEELEDVEDIEESEVEDEEELQEELDP